MTEVVQTVKNPRTRPSAEGPEATSRPIENENFFLGSPLQKYADAEYFKEHARSASARDIQSVSSVHTSPPESKKTSKKKGRSSLLGSARSSLMG